MTNDSHGACCGSCAHAKLVEEGKLSYAPSPPLRLAPEGGAVVLLGRCGADVLRVPLARGGKWIIGRSATASQLVFADSALGRQTCFVEVSDSGQVFVEDMGSSCGTFVNGHRVIRAGLHEKDEIRVGTQTVITFEVA